MTSVAGASKYLNAATLANLKGISAQSPSLLGGGDGSAQGLLEAGRSALAIRGFGASPGTRSQNQQLLSRSADVNKMFSLGAGSGATLEGMRQQILALRGRLSDAQLAPDLRGGTVDEKA